MTKVVFGYQSRLLASQRHRSSGCGLEIHFTLVLYSKPSVIVSVCVFVYVAFILREADLSISMFKSACGD